MVDGKPYKALGRHLRANGTTLIEYRQRYKLPADYPMVSAVYSEQRSSFAKQIGLGRRRSGTVEEGPRRSRAAPSDTVESTDGVGKAAATRGPRTRKLFSQEALAKVRAKAATG